MAEPIVQIRELTKIYAQGEIQVTALGPHLAGYRGAANFWR